MHLATTMKHWSHHLHDDMVSIRHELGEKMHHRRFWIGTGIALLIIGFMTLMAIALWRMPPGMLEHYQYGIPYTLYRV